MAAASKKAGREAANGLVGIATSDDGRTGAIVEVNSETDFVSRNELFVSLVQRAPLPLLAAADSDGKTDFDLDDITGLALPGGDTMGADISLGDGVTELAGKVRENLVLRRGTALRASEGGVVASYVHNAAGPNIGIFASLVALSASPAADVDGLSRLGKLLAMQVVAARPTAATRDQIDEDAIERERQLLIEQAKAEPKPKPDDIIVKMVEGRLGKFFQENVLTEQECMVADVKKVSDLVKDYEKELGSKIVVEDFVHFRCGEGAEDEE